MNKKIKVIFLGRGKIASNCYDIIRKKIFKIFFQVSSVVSNKKFFLKKKININKKIYLISNQNRNEKKIIQIVKKNKIEIIISVHHPWILSEKLLKLVNYRAYNLHNADLPSYKGWNGISHTIINSEKKHFTNIHQMTKNVDEGNVILKKKINIKRHENAKILYIKSLNTASINFQNFLINLKKNNIIFTSSNKKAKFYGKNKLNLMKNLKVNISEKNYKIILGSYIPPYEPAYTLHKGKKIYFLPETSLKELINKQKKINDV